jgi:hypothetical protein
MIATDFFFVTLFYRLFALYGDQVPSTARASCEYRAASQNICQYWRNISITLTDQSVINSAQKNRKSGRLFILRATAILQLPLPES